MTKNNKITFYFKKIIKIIYIYIIKIKIKDKKLAINILKNIT